MATLFDITELVANNEFCAVLKVKEGHEMDLIALGVFNGDETMLRLTKGDNVTCTVFRKNQPPYSWHWGYGSHTLVDPSMKTQGELIQKCIERDYNIECQTS